MEKIKEMKEMLIDAVHEHMSQGIDKVDTKELGEAIDMIKDLTESCYYIKVTESMNNKEHDDSIDDLVDKLLEESDMMTPEQKMELKRKISMM